MYILIKQITLKQGNKYTSVSLPNYFTGFYYHLCSLGYLHLLYLNGGNPM